MPRCALLKLRNAHGAAAAQASFTLPKRLIKAVRFVPAVRLGFLSFIAENVGCAFCASPLGFYGMAAVGLLALISALIIEASCSAYRLPALLLPLPGSTIGSPPPCSPR